MQVTFLIGNGFDLGIGLKTAYSDFYRVYCAETQKDDENLRNFKSAIQLKSETWSDFENAFGKYSSELNDTAVYLELFENFVNSFISYIRNEEQRFDESKLDNAVEGMSKAFSTYYKIRPADAEVLRRVIDRNDVYFNFVTFNYTNCLDKCFNAVKEKAGGCKFSGGYISELVHVHGYIDDLIMGVNDETQIANKAFAENLDVIEGIIKPVQNQIIRMNYDERATKLIKNSTIVCIYGMSVGSTDKKWWKLIMEWLQENSARHLIVLSHEAGSQTVFQWNRTVKRIRRNLFTYGEVSDDKKKPLESQIHIQTNHDIFSMNLVKSQQLGGQPQTMEDSKDITERVRSEIEKMTATDAEVSGMLDEVFN